MNEQKGIPTSARWDPSGLLGSPSPVNMVIGARSLGKTFGIVKRAIRNFIEDGEQFVYLRRTDKEITRMLGVSDFLSPFAEYFPEWEMRVHGRTMEMRRKGTEDKWSTLGAFVPLSAAASYKSSAFPKVSIIFFDEFISEKGMYWPNEVDSLMGFWETVDRRNERTRIYMAANAADAVNPYFTEWDLTLPTKGKTRTYKHNESSITIQYADDAEFKAYAARTSIGRFTSGTNYARYAQNNDFLEDHDTLIGSKTSASLFRCELRFDRRSYGIWYDMQEGNWYVNAQIPKDEGREMYALLRRDLKPNTILLERASPVLKTLKRGIQQGYVYFDTVARREGFLKSMGLLGMR